MKEDTIIFILCMSTGIFALAIQAWAEPAWIADARKAKIECEENIPRKETCVIIALPRSKE
jgi:hypothetical protein